VTCKVNPIASFRCVFGARPDIADLRLIDLTKTCCLITWLSGAGCSKSRYRWLSPQSAANAVAEWTSMIKISLAATALVALAGNASAQGLFSFDEADGGLFVSGFVGSSAPGDGDLSGAGTRLEAEFETSAAFGGAVGYRLPFKYWTYFQPRLELEISSAQSDVSGSRLNGNPVLASGELSSTTFLFNNYNDITWLSEQTIVPFLGGGLGFSRLDLSVAGEAAPGGAAAFAFEDDTTALTTTFAGGLTWHAKDQFEIYGEARYTKVYGAEFEQVSVGSFATQAFEDDLTAATFTVGARIGF